MHAGQILAAALLICPAERLAIAPLWPLFAKVSHDLQALALDLQILDPREVRYILARPEDFLSDLNLIRRRLHELGDAPRVDDALRFPDRATVNDLLSLNREHRLYLELCQSIAHPFRRQEWQAALRETDRLHQLWDKVRDARCDYYYVTVRRSALKQLRELAGAEAYHAGDLPAVIPLHH